jgi:hypothetical protein
LKTRVFGGIRQVEPNYFAPARGQVHLRFAVDEDDVAEASHRGVSRLARVERRDAPALDEHVVERDHQLPMRRWPVVGIGRDHENVPVQTHLLTVVLADVRVVPVGARVRELEAVLEALADLDRLLRRLGAVVAIVQPQSVPVARRLEIAVVLDVHGHARTLCHLEEGPWD